MVPKANNRSEVTDDVYQYWPLSRVTRENSQSKFLATLRTRLNSRKRGEKRTGGTSTGEFPTGRSIPFRGRISSLTASQSLITSTTVWLGFRNTDEYFFLVQKEHVKCVSAASRSLTRTFGTGQCPRRKQCVYDTIRYAA